MCPSLREAVSWCHLCIAADPVPPFLSLFPLEPTRTPLHLLASKPTTPTHNRGAVDTEEVTAVAILRHNGGTLSAVWPAHNFSIRLLPALVRMLLRLPRTTQI